MWKNCPLGASIVLRGSVRATLGLSCPLDFSQMLSYSQHYHSPNITTLPAFETGHYTTLYYHWGLKGIKDSQLKHKKISSM